MAKHTPQNVDDLIARLRMAIEAARSAYGRYQALMAPEETLVACAAGA